MKESIRLKLENLCERHEEVGMLLGDPEIISNQNKFRELSMEYSQLEPVTKAFGDYCTAQEDIASANEMLKEDDAEMREMAAEEKKDAEQRIETLEMELQNYSCPKTHTTTAISFLKYVPVPVGMKRLFLQATYLECTAVMQKPSAGRLK